jgi:hypothetical protein
MTKRGLWLPAEALGGFWHVKLRWACHSASHLGTGKGDVPPESRERIIIGPKAYIVGLITAPKVLIGYK